MEVNKYTSDNWGYFVDLENFSSNFNENNEIIKNKNIFKLSKFNYHDVVYKEYCDEYKFNTNNLNSEKMKNIVTRYVNNNNNKDDIKIEKKNYFINITTGFVSISLTFLFLHFLNLKYNSKLVTHFPVNYIPNIVQNYLHHK